MENERRRRTITSSIGEKNFGERFNERVAINIEDTSGFDDPQEDNGMEAIDAMRSKLQSAREQKKAEVNFVPKNTVSRLEILVGLGRLTVEVPIDGVIFVLRSLKSGERRAVVDAAIKQTTNLNQLLDEKDYTLAYSLSEIDGLPVGNYIKDTLQNRIELVRNLEEHVVDLLWKKYGEMMSNHHANIGKDLGETPEEIIENIKKS